MPRRICFNPCSNGMKKELEKIAQNEMVFGFNPCSNGMKKELTVDELLKDTE